MSGTMTQLVPDRGSQAAMHKMDARVCNGDGATCAECGKFFSHPFYFSTHISAHTIEKDFLVVGQCVLCGLIFSNPATFEAHLASSQARMESQIAQEAKDAAIADGPPIVTEAGNDSIIPNMDQPAPTVVEKKSDKISRAQKRPISEQEVEMTQSAVSHPGQADRKEPAHKRARRPPEKYDPSSFDDLQLTPVESDPEVEAYLQSLSDMGLTVDPAAFSTPRGVRRGGQTSRGGQMSRGGRGSRGKMRGKTKRIFEPQVFFPEAVIERPKKPSPKYEYLDYDALLEEEVEVLPKSGKLTRAERLQQRQERLSLSKEEGGGIDVSKLRTVKLEADDDEKKGRKRKGSTGRRSSVTEDIQKNFVAVAGTLFTGRGSAVGRGRVSLSNVRPKLHSIDTSQISCQASLAPRFPMGSGVRGRGVYRGMVGNQQQRATSRIQPNFVTPPLSRITSKKSNSIADIKRDSREYVEKMLQSAGVLAVSTNVVNKGATPVMKGTGAMGFPASRKIGGSQGPFLTSPYPLHNFKEGQQQWVKSTRGGRPREGMLVDSSVRSGGFGALIHPGIVHSTPSSIRTAVPTSSKMCESHVASSQQSQNSSGRGDSLNGQRFIRGQQIGSVRGSNVSSTRPTALKPTSASGEIIVIDDDDELNNGKMEKEGMNVKTSNNRRKSKEGASEKCSVTIRDIDKDGQNVSIKDISEGEQLSMDTSETEMEEEVSDILQGETDIEGWKVCLAQDSDSGDDLQGNDDAEKNKGDTTKKIDNEQNSGSCVDDEKEKNDYYKGDNDHTKQRDKVKVETGHDKSSAKSSSSDVDTSKQDQSENVCPAKSNGDRGKNESVNPETSRIPADLDKSGDPQENNSISYQNEDLEKDSSSSSSLLWDRSTHNKDSDKSKHSFSSDLVPPSKAFRKSTNPNPTFGDLGYCDVQNVFPDKRDGHGKDMETPDQEMDKNLPNNEKNIKADGSVILKNDQVPCHSKWDDGITDCGYSSSQSNHRTSPVPLASPEKISTDADLSLAFQTTSSNFVTSTWKSDDHSGANDSSSSDGKAPSTPHPVEESSNLLDIFSEIERTCKEIEGNSEGEGSGGETGMDNSNGKGESGLSSDSEMTDNKNEIPDPGKMRDEEKSFSGSETMLKIASVESEKTKEVRNLPAFLKSVQDSDRESEDLTLEKEVNFPDKDRRNLTHDDLDRELSVKVDTGFENRRNVTGNCSSGKNVTESNSGVTDRNVKYSNCDDEERKATESNNDEMERTMMASDTEERKITQTASDEKDENMTDDDSYDKERNVTDGDHDRDKNLTDDGCDKESSVKDCDSDKERNVKDCDSGRESNVKDCDSDKEKNVTGGGHDKGRYLMDDGCDKERNMKDYSGDKERNVMVGDCDKERNVSDDDNEKVRNIVDNGSKNHKGDISPNGSHEPTKSESCQKEINLSEKIYNESVKSKLSAVVKDEELLIASVSGNFEEHQTVIDGVKENNSDGEELCENNMDISNFSKTDEELIQVKVENELCQNKTGNEMNVSDMCEYVGKDLLDQQMEVDSQNTLVSGTSSEKMLSVEPKTQQNISEEVTASKKIMDSLELQMACEDGKVVKFENVDSSNINENNSANVKLASFSENSIISDKEDAGNLGSKNVTDETDDRGRCNVPGGDGSDGTKTAEKMVTLGKEYGQESIPPDVEMTEESKEDDGSCDIEDQTDSMTVDDEGGNCSKEEFDIKTEDNVVENEEENEKRKSHVDTVEEARSQDVREEEEKERKTETKDNVNDTLKVKCEEDTNNVNAVNESHSLSKDELKECSKTEGQECTEEEMRAGWRNEAFISMGGGEKEEEVKRNTKDESNDAELKDEVNEFIDVRGRNENDDTQEICEVDKYVRPVEMDVQMNNKMDHIDKNTISDLKETDKPCGQDLKTLENSKSIDNTSEVFATEESWTGLNSDEVNAALERKESDNTRTERREHIEDRETALSHIEVMDRVMESDEQRDRRTEQPTGKL